LRAALRSIERRGNYRLLENLVLSAYAHAGDRPLDWGRGGPEFWPAARPYFTPPGSQDQRGFCIGDWYIATAQAVTGQANPLLLFGLGNHPSNLGSSQLDENARTQRILAMAKALALQDKSEGAGKSSLESIEPLPPQVLCGNFWLLASDSRSQTETWFQPNEINSHRAHAPFLIDSE
jgi:hypothetical protein